MTAVSPIRGDYRETLHWATARDGFDSVLTIFNYLGWAFAGHEAADTDAEVFVRFFEEDGVELAPYRTSLPTGRSLHLRIGHIHPRFQGITATAMTPRGNMPRRSAAPNRPGRPIATSHFMLYEREGGFRDFSHELFPVRERPEGNPRKWATVLSLGIGLEPAAIVMNNRPAGPPPDSEARIAVRLFALDGKALTGEYRFSLPPGGSRMLRIAEAFPDVNYRQASAAIAMVTARNIEQPMSLHLHSSGDFNLHHF